MTTTHERARLVERVRALFSDSPATREVAMFGGQSFMVNDKMVTHALKDGDLLVRVDPKRDDELTKLPGASRAEMGPGRTMGPGWIAVSAESISGEEELSFWIGTALEHNRTTAGNRK